MSWSRPPVTRTSRSRARSECQQRLWELPLVKLQMVKVPKPGIDIKWEFTSALSISNHQPRQFVRLLNFQSILEWMLKLPFVIKYGLLRGVTFRKIAFYLWFYSYSLNKDAWMRKPIYCLVNIHLRRIQLYSHDMSHICCIYSLATLAQTMAGNTFTHWSLFSVLRCGIECGDTRGYSFWPRQECEGGYHGKAYTCQFDFGPLTFIPKF